ncbi:MAG: type II secretion system protein [Rickettsiales bacterium]
MQPPPAKSGFSLVELSIVLVILGLLTGGILAGQSLIRAAELRSVATEYAKYTTAAQSFRDKYFAIPGDMSNATQFWGRLNSNADCLTNSSSAITTPGTCDGNGDGSISFQNAASQSQEGFQYWRQLANAGLIEGSYTGIAGPAALSDTLAGINAPASKLANAGWGINTINAYLDGSAGIDFSGYYGTYYFMGGKGNGTPPWNPVIKPEEAWNIDTKMDDGKPGTGKILAGERPTCTTASNATDYTAQYALSTTASTCKLYFIKLF